MKRILFTLLIISIGLQTTAQTNKKELDKEAIKKMCGCFEVTFNFAETFNYSNDSLYKPSKNKVSKGLEWAQLVTDKEDQIEIQHLLQVGSPEQPMIVKHWRQNWLYENTNLYSYNADNVWTYENKSADEVAGQWTQKVYQVDDSPRYEGSATWVHVDGKSYWENIANAPLPRREYTTRSDYNLTVRGNRQEITPYGWVHDQDNSKVVRTANQEDRVIAKEKGYNTYKRVDDSKCAAAAQWWVDNQEKWALVRTKWDEVYNKNKDLHLEQKVDNKVLYKHLFGEGYEDQKSIDQLIESFVKE
ncbi:DUF6607 family protein [Dokdonia donghaensis]|uniref:Uncharacterized protein n=1 Tax=Dokdonia donghaensis DSW-1 TaxID=1300343 RepID=A0A0A2GU01_9FLAO|nr:DUF6607 family protein [Dokdonia donghaensis]ANH60746.1 hypothetical protein I597_1844 [Dokdonia donghaensis DSW-1]KGO05983.1 hypothetical protein NV36_03420 [Dokdonia donghaensis DSW-1]